MKNTNCGEAEVTGFSFAGFWIDLEKVKANIADPESNPETGVTYTTKYQFVECKSSDNS